MEAEEIIKSVKHYTDNLYSLVVFEHGTVAMHQKQGEEFTEADGLARLADQTLPKAGTPNGDLTCAMDDGRFLTMFDEDLWVITDAEEAGLAEKVAKAQENPLTRVGLNPEVHLVNLEVGLIAREALAKDVENGNFVGLFRAIPQQSGEEGPKVHPQAAEFVRGVVLVSFGDDTKGLLEWAKDADPELLPGDMPEGAMIASVGYLQGVADQMGLSIEEMLKVWLRDRVQE